MQLSGDVVKNYKIWYVWDGEKYEISEKDEYNYLIEGKFLVSEADCPPGPTSEDLRKLVKGCEGKIQLVLKERSMKVLKSKFRGALQRIL